MEATKILLSADELNLVQNTHWLLTKNNIIEKAKAMFGGLAASMQDEINANAHKLPEIIHLFSPKVFKGEYYQGLPYVMLDYPRVFTKEDVLAIRTMFWWGNFFSVTLQLKGSYRQLYGDKLLQNRELLAAKGFYVSVSEDEWRHDFQPDNYVPVELNSDKLEQAIKGPFVKLAAKIELSHWNDALQLVGEYQLAMIRLLAD
jgi:hypothetical protein